MDIIELVALGLLFLVAIISFFFYQRNNQLSLLISDKQSLEIKNSEIIVKLDNLTDIKDSYLETSKLLEDKKIEFGEYKEELTKTKTLLEEQVNKFNTFEKSSSKHLEDLKIDNSLLKESNENKSVEIGNLKENLSKYKTSFEEQKQKNEELINSSEKRINELKEEITNLKILNNNDNEQIKHYKAEVSELNTKVEKEQTNTQNLLHEKNERLNQLLNQYDSLKNDYKNLQQISITDKETISQLQTSIEEQNKSMQEKLKILQNSEEKLKIEFENLANKIFTDNSKKFSEQNQKDLGLILNPMQQQLVEFKKKVEDVYDKESKDRTALQQELKSLKELNLQMSNEAHKLTLALKNDNKKQGSWGEMVLERVLENSGLREGYEYRREVTLKDNDDKPFRPDVIVDLPDKRNIIIDAKTSLTAYTEYISEVDENMKNIQLKNHINSIKSHIKGLADKQYENLKGVNTLDFIFMFIPIEGALLLALDNDISLYDNAFKQKIILVSPTTLLVALRAVENTWRYERQAQNIADVYFRAEELYKKFSNFVDDLKKVGKAIQTADETYNEAFKKLTEGKGNLISQVTMLKKVSDIKPKKEIDSVLVEKALITDEN